MRARALGALLVGTFAASEEGLHCVLTLERGPGRLLLGRLRLGDLAFELRGRASRRAGLAHGLVLEPGRPLPLALARLCAGPEGLTLELDVAARDDPATLELARLAR